MRAGTFRRTLAIASDPAIVRLVAGLDALVEYPGCTEQRISLASAGVAAQELHADHGSDRSRQAHRARQNTQTAIDQAIDADGLAFWPRARRQRVADRLGFLPRRRQARGRADRRKLAERLANDAETIAAFRIIRAR